jgi:hypothetical protein
MKTTSFVLCGLVVFSFTLAGCQKPDAGTAGGSGVVAHDHDHDHDGQHEHPTSLLEGYQMLGDLYGQIKAAFEKNDPEAAHDQLHEVAHILDEDMPGLILNNEALSDDQKSELKNVITKLFEEFSKLDDVLHGGPEIDFSNVNSEIEQAMNALKALIQ